MPTPRSALGAEIDHMVRHFDHVKMVLNNQDRVAMGGQFLQKIQQAWPHLRSEAQWLARLKCITSFPCRALKVRARASPAALRHLRASSNFGLMCCSQADPVKCLEFARDMAMVFEKLKGFFDGISSTSAMDLSLNFTLRISRLYRRPWHTSHLTKTSLKKCISTRT